VNLNAILKIEYYLSIVIEATYSLYFTNNYLTVDLEDISVKIVINNLNSVYQLIGIKLLYATLK
jgi:hypothetical protein